VKVLTLNLWGTNPPAAERLAALVAYLRRERPDVVALQEVEDWEDVTQAHHLAEQAGYPSVHAVRTGTGLRRGEGLAVLAGGRLRPVGTVSLPSSVTDHPRAVQIVDVAVSPSTGDPAGGEAGDAAASAGVVRIANTHLAWRLGATDLRVAQAEAIRDALRGSPGPAVVAGDLNDVPASPPLRVLTEAGFVDAVAAAGAAERPTFDAANPYLWQPELAGRRVDHLLVRQLRVHDAAVVLTGEDAPMVSDHFGVCATMTPAEVS